jgi:hypothetical protein
MRGRTRNIAAAPSKDWPDSNARQKPDHSLRDERHPVDMRGLATLEDGRTMAVLLVNLSYDGCAVESAVPLTEGSALLLTTCGGSIEAQVRWVSGRTAGLRFHGERSGRIQKTPGLIPRESARVAVELTAKLKRFGRTGNVVPVSDISITGRKAEFADRPQVGETVTLRFDGLDSIEANVRWVGGRDCGLDFSSPIHPAILELLLQRHGKAA